MEVNVHTLLFVHLFCVVHIPSQQELSMSGKLVDGVLRNIAVSCTALDEYCKARNYRFTFS